MYVRPQIMVEIVQALHIGIGLMGDPLLIPIERMYVLVKQYEAGLPVKQTARQAWLGKSR